MNSKLLPALKTAIRALEADIVPYNWSKPHSCNCGVVVQAITGKDKAEVSRMHRGAEDEAVKRGLVRGEDISGAPYSATWRQIAQYSCTVTGSPIGKMMTALYDLGLTAEDIVHLEYLNNPAILKEANIKTGTGYYANQTTLVSYLKAWVRIIEKQSQRKGFNAKDNLHADYLIAKALGSKQEVEALAAKLN